MPSIVLTARPWAWTASMMQERTACPSTCTVHAPQTPCSHPKCVPVRSRSSRKKSPRLRLTSISRTWGEPFTSMLTVRRELAPWFIRSSFLPIELRARLRHGAQQRAPHEHTGHRAPVARGSVHVRGRVHCRGRHCRSVFEQLPHWLLPNEHRLGVGQPTGYVV